jgi:hypothetical protein
MKAIPWRSHAARAEAAKVIGVFLAQRVQPEREHAAFKRQRASCQDPWMAATSASRSGSNRAPDETVWKRLRSPCSEARPGNAA